jgi:hypothetical protein
MAAVFHREIGWRIAHAFADGQKKRAPNGALLIVWQRGAGLTCVGSVSTFLSGEDYPKPEILGVRLVFVNVMVRLLFFLICCVFCNDFIIAFWPGRSCDLLHRLTPCNTS